MKTILTLIMLSGILFAESAHHHAGQIDTNKNQEILDSMHQGMQGVSMSCNINIDFLTDMIPHHQMAIDSATMYLDEAKNEILKEIAQKIIDVQSDEIEYFQELIDKLNKEKKDCDSVSYKEFQDKTQMNMEAMMQGMYKEQSGDIDIDFAKAMIEHHKGAVANAKLILEYSNNAEIKEIAKNIIQTQDEEIEQMQKAINN